MAARGYRHTPSFGTLFSLLTSPSSPGFQRVSAACCWVSGLSLHSFTLRLPACVLVSPFRHQRDQLTA